MTAIANPEPRPDLTRISCWREAGGVRIHSVVCGAGHPVVLIHGYGISGTYMLPLARALADSFMAFVPDLPGQGKSDQPRGAGDIPYLAEALGDWLDASGLIRPAFVANSLGCQIVTELAVRRPQRVGPMVLVGPTVDPARRAARHQLICALRDSASEPFAILALAARGNAAAGIRGLLSTARSALADRIEERLPLIDQPTVVVLGERDGFVGAEWAERAAALLPRGRLVVVPGEPHAVHYTRPDLVAGIVCELLVEEREDRSGQLPRRLEHRDVSALEEDEPRAGERPLPLLRDPERHEVIPLTPHD
jgi:2-hydroxy-6-oxonona-2,4-dienedioate hydrolase